MGIVNRRKADEIRWLGEQVEELIEEVRKVASDVQGIAKREVNLDQSGEYNTGMLAEKGDALVHSWAGKVGDEHVRFGVLEGDDGDGNAFLTADLIEGSKVARRAVSRDIGHIMDSCSEEIERFVKMEAQIVGLLLLIADAKVHLWRNGDEWGIGSVIDREFTIHGNLFPVGPIEWSRQRFTSDFADPGTAAVRLLAADMAHFLPAIAEQGVGLSATDVHGMSNEQGREHFHNQPPPRE